MNFRTIASLSLAGLMLGGTMVGCTTGGIASASSRSDALAAKQAAENAGKASKALARNDAVTAVSFAEAAVALRPQDAGYRVLLGASYLKAGRFASAHAAYGDVLTLTPNHGKAVLNMTLAMIAEGKWDAARKTLDTHTGIISPTDRGLAMALAGDPAGGVDVLVAATRSPDATGQTRQNLALAMALAGRWKEARAIIGVDMAPIEADQRIVQWAAFAKPVGAADQVASLLGVHPAADPGQPVALALNAAVPVAAVAPPAVEPMRVVPPVAVATLTPPAGAVAFAARHETVQALPQGTVPTIAAPRAFKVAAARPVAAPAALKAAAKGDWYVQLGAFTSLTVARDAWSRVQRRHVMLGDRLPTGATVKTGAGQFYRLSVGGFTRADADSLCRRYRVRGGACFVRAGAGDRVASWYKTAPAVKLAAVKPKAGVQIASK